MLTGLILAAAALTALPAPVRGDFDHDGRQDVAEVTAEGDGYRLIVRHASGKVSQIEAFNGEEVANLYVEKAEPGLQKTWCGKGGGLDNAPCPQPAVTLTGDTLAYGAKEASQSVAIWNGRSFDIVLMSD